MAYFGITLVNILLFFFKPYIATFYLYVIVGYLLLIKGGRLEDKLIRSLVYTTPFYYFSLWGKVQRVSMCITVAFFLLVILTLDVMRTSLKTTRREGILLFCVFSSTILYCASVAFSMAPSEVLLDTYQLVILMWVVLFITITSRKQIIIVDAEALFEEFCIGICAVAASVYIQYLLRQILDTTVGYVFVWNQGSRVIYNSIYVAKSVLSLYLAIGMLHYFIKLITYTKVADAFRIVFIGGAILLNNSRTGLMCFIAVATIYIVFHLNSMVKNAKILCLLVLGVVAVAYTMQSMLASRSSLTGFIDDNGRVALLQQAYMELKNYFVIGIGGSSSDYNAVFGNETPIHNFVFQYLIQFGVIAGVLIVAFLGDCFLSAKGTWKYYIGIVFLGGMLFTNWQNALFIFPTLILSIIGSNSLSTQHNVNSI